MRKRGKKQLAILLSAALVMQGQAVYGANVEKTGVDAAVQEAAEINAPGDEDPAPDDNENNEKEDMEDISEGEEDGKDEENKDEENPEEIEEPEGGSGKEKEEEEEKDTTGHPDEKGENDDSQNEDQKDENEPEDPDEKSDLEDETDQENGDDPEEKKDPGEISDENSFSDENVLEEEKDQESEEEKILSWKWKDEQEILIEGELRLSVTEEDQISFEDVVSMLPAEVTANVGIEDDEAEVEEMDLPVLGWTCEEYIQDENGKWPTSGEFIFVAELPEEYTLGDGVTVPEVKVVLEMPGVALMADDWADMISIDGTGYEIEKLNDINYTLKLDGFNGSNITISQGTWTINVNDSNEVNATGSALNLLDNVKVTITGSGTLNLTGSIYGIEVGNGTTLDIQGGTINAEGNNNKAAKTAGIIIARNAKMTVSGGMITANGSSDNRGVGNGIDIMDGGRLYMTGGSVKASAKTASLSLSGTAEIRYGTLDASYILFDNTTSANSLQVTDSGHVISSQITVCGSGAELEVNGANAELECSDKLYIGEGTPTPNVTVNAGTLTANNINNKGEVTLQGGTLVLNGTYTKEGSGTFDYKGGSITGSGSFADGSKIPVTITKYSFPDPRLSIPGNIDVSRYFKITPSDIGKVTYSVNTDGINENERSEGTLGGEDNRILTVTKTGKLNIKAEVAATEIFASAEAEIQISVVKGTIMDGNVANPYNSSYDGKTHDAVNINLGLIENIQDAEVWYAEYDGSTEPADSAYSKVVPVVKNVSDSGKNYYVWIKSSNYDEYKNPSGKVKITATDNWKVDVAGGTYNGKVQTPKLDVYYYNYNSNTKGESMVEGTDYNVTCSSSEPVLNAGTYDITITGIGNYRTEQNKKFTINKYDLSGATVTVKSGPFYNGTSQTLTKDQIEVEAGDLTVPTDDYEISFGTDTEVGSKTTVTITAKNNSTNFTGSKTASFTIKPAPLTITGAVLEPKTYDKTMQAAVKSVQFAGLIGSQELSSEDYTATAQFMDANAGTDKDVRLNVSLKETEATKNYELADTTFTLTGQTIQKAPALVLPDVNLSYSYDRTGEGTVNIHSILPEDAGGVTAMTAEVTSDDTGALDTQVRTDPQTGLVSFRLLGNKMENIGKTAEITVSGIQTTNYEDMTAKIMITLVEKKTTDTPIVDPTPSVPDGSGNSNGSHTSSGNSSGSSDGSSGESSSSKPAQSGQKDTPAQDGKKGWYSPALGIITGEENGYSRWEKTESKTENNSPSQTWKLRYADGNYAAGTMETAADGTAYEQPHWEMVNGKWYAFGADQYAKDGWVYDPKYETWFYIDIDRGMYTGWVFINGKWYYFHPISDGRKGAMYKEQQTPDGYYVDENGAWNGKE